MEKQITVIPGDGIGPEVTREATKVLNAIANKYGHQFHFDHVLMGACAIDQSGSALPEPSLNSALNSDAVLLGAIGDPKYDNDPTAKVRPEQGLLQLRKSLNLFANIRPVKTYSAISHLSPIKTANNSEIDFVIYRELTSGIYFGEKQLSEDGNTASDSCTYQKYEIERVARLAFEAARKRRKKLTLVDKANVLETSRLWRKTVKELHEDYKDVQLDFLFVDNAAMQIIINPAQFDVMLTENMFGDILSDEASVISGSLGLLPSASIGEKALFEPIHGSYPQAANKDIANPLGSILSAAMLLEYFDAHEEALSIRNAVDWTLANGFVTKDIDAMNSYGTSTIGDLVVDVINNEIPQHLNKRNVRMGQTTII